VKPGRRSRRRERRGARRPPTLRSTPLGALALSLVLLDGVSASAQSAPGLRGASEAAPCPGRTPDAWVDFVHSSAPLYRWHEGRLEPVVAGGSPQWDGSDLVIPVRVGLIDADGEAVDAPALARWLDVVREELSRCLLIRSHLVGRARVRPATPGALGAVVVRWRGERTRAATVLSDPLLRWSRLGAEGRRIGLDNRRNPNAPSRKFHASPVQSPETTFVEQISIALGPTALDLKDVELTSLVADPSRRHLSAPPPKRSSFSSTGPRFDDPATDRTMLVPRSFPLPDAERVQLALLWRGVRVEIQRLPADLLARRREAGNYELILDRIVEPRSGAGMQALRQRAELRWSELYGASASAPDQPPSAVLIVAERGWTATPPR